MMVTTVNVDNNNDNDIMLYIHEASLMHICKRAILYITYAYTKHPGVPVPMVFPVSRVSLLSGAVIIEVIIVG